MRGLIEEQENEEDKREERKSSNPAISVFKILNTSLLTLVACLGIERYVEQEALMIADTYPVSFISWGIGAVIWSFFIMNSLSKNLNSVNLSKALKIQFALNNRLLWFLVDVLHRESWIYNFLNLALGNGYCFDDNLG